MRKLIKSGLLLTFIILHTNTFAHVLVQREYYEIRIFHATSQQQIGSLDQYLQTAYLPALHRAGIANVGAFHLIGNDTATDKKVYLLIPLKSIEKAGLLEEQLEKDQTFQTARQEYWNAAFDKAAYTRFETIILRAFEEMPQLEAPKLNSPRSERVYELRSYESPTERLNINKVSMFNKGGEVKLFKSLGFNAVFYGEVIAGCKMPNLMYMTTFENKEAREEHWKTFGNNPTWKTLSSLPEYQHNVSKAEIFFLTPADYSDF